MDGDSYSEWGNPDPRRQAICYLSFVNVSFECSYMCFIWNTHRDQGIIKGLWGIECNDIKGRRETAKEEGLNGEGERRAE